MTQISHLTTRLRRTVAAALLVLFGLAVEGAAAHPTLVAVAQSDAERAGRVVGRLLVIGAVVALIIWLVIRNRRR